MAVPCFLHFCGVCTHFSSYFFVKMQVLHSTNRLLAFLKRLLAFKNTLLRDKNTLLVFREKVVPNVAEG